ncbi:MAG: DUF3820 family protein [Spirochaetales bacterium]|nr:DUF3820 family protein [Spirochaetales bacterium]
MKIDENQEFLLELANTKIPFGKYAGRYLVDLPETYVLWFKEKGYPQGKLGLMMELLMEIKLNGLEGLIRPLRMFSGARHPGKIFQSDLHLNLHFKHVVAMFPHFFCVSVYFGAWHCSQSFWAFVESGAMFISENFQTILLK